MGETKHKKNTAKNITLPTTCRQTTANANVDAKKHHRQEDSQEDNAADGVHAGNGVGAINGNEAVVKAVDNIKAANAFKAAKATNVNTEVEGVNAITNAKGGVYLYATALINSLFVHEDVTDATITAENTKKAMPL
jgi:hypothetical protein